MKAQGLQLSTIILAILGLIVLIILVVMVGNKMGLFGTTISKCPTPAVCDTCTADGDVSFGQFECVKPLLCCKKATPA